MNKQALLDVLKIASPAVEDSTAFPALKYICFRDGKAMTTNLRLSIIVPFHGITGMLPHRLLLNILAVSDAEEIELTENETGWTLKAGKSVHKLGKSQSISDFPLEPQFPEENSFKLSAEDSAALSDSVKFCGVENSGAEGCFIGKDIVGTNGLYVFKYDSGFDCSLHLPALFVTCIKGMAGEINYNKNFAAFQINGAKFMTQQLEAKYPGYQAVFSGQYDWNVKISKEALIAECKKILAYNSPIENAKFTFDNGIVRVDFTDLNTNDQYNGEALYEGLFNGKIGLNVNQLMLILNTLNTELIEIYLREPYKSVYFRNQNSDKLIILVQPTQI